MLVVKILILWFLVGAVVTPTLGKFLAMTSEPR